MAGIKGANDGNRDYEWEISDLGMIEYALDSFFWIFHRSSQGLCVFLAPLCSPPQPYLPSSLRVALQVSGTCFSPTPRQFIQCVTGVKRPLSPPLQHMASRPTMKIANVL